MKKQPRSHHFGFTLIELLVVIAIIGVLTAIILPNMMGMRKRARDSQRKAALQELKTALRLYYNDFQSYPSASSDDIVGCGTTASPTTCTWGEEFAKNNTTYMKQLPSDSLNSYHYEQIDADSFRAWIELENDADQDIATSQTRCGTATGAPDNAYYVCSD